MQAGVHSLVESLYGLQGERSKLRGELRLLHSQLEQKERDRHSRVQAFQQQVQCCKTAEAPYLFQEQNNGETLLLCPCHQLFIQDEITVPFMNVK